jgi:hypothetical protein
MYFDMRFSSDGVRAFTRHNKRRRVSAELIALLECRTIADLTCSPAEGGMRLQACVRVMLRKLPPDGGPPGRSETV